MRRRLDPSWKGQSMAIEKETDDFWAVSSVTSNDIVDKDRVGESARLSRVVAQGACLVLAEGWFKS